MTDIDKLIEFVIGAAFRVHNTLGAGFLEKVYERALCVELRKLGIEYKVQYPIAVYYDDEIVGDYFADLLIENCLIVELKSVEEISIKHQKQLVNYLVATQIDNGLLLNFAYDKVHIKRKFRTYSRPNNFNM